ncbi:MAG: 16S rRNA (cytidine(1402)-2'-O)-methyltransferase, partial [Ruthenibacterium sp.]
RLAALLHEERTIIFYEAPHKLTTTLADLENTVGAQRALTVCRELTKMHEEIKVTTVGDANAYYQQNAPRGEFVLVMAGAPVAENIEMTLAQAVDYAKRLMADGQSATSAAKQAANISPFSKSEIYKECL